MPNPYKVSYVLSGITKRTDLFDMENGTERDAIKAIQNKFHGVWGFDPDAIQVAEIVSGHYEEKLCTRTDARPCWLPGQVLKVFVEG